MYEDITYEQLKELPDEQKKEALILLKQQYPSYKEMSNKIGGTPAALSHYYLSLVEGQKFGRKKKEEKASAITEAPVTNETKPQRRGRKKSEKSLESNAIVTIDKKDEIVAMPPKKAISFTIGLDVEINGDEAKARVEGIIGSLLKDKQYKVKLTIEEV